VPIPPPPPPLTALVYLTAIPTPLIPLPLFASLLLNGSITVVPKATFFNGRTFSLAQAAARVFASSSKASTTRATCVGSTCFDSFFDQTSSRTSVDASSRQSISMFMNYNSATQAARTPSIATDSRGDKHNFLVSCLDCWAYVSASVTFAASFQLIIDADFPPAQHNPGTPNHAKLLIL
jgi:hypothetical protein